MTTILVTPIAGGTRLGLCGAVSPFRGDRWGKSIGAKGKPIGGSGNPIWGSRLTTPSDRD